MPNHYFKFKQFTIQQEFCAMKVASDSCLFGAIVANFLQDRIIPIKNCLDVGTGTGLLSLMLAQKTTAEITAIEIEANACLQAQQNVLASPWANKIKILQQNILTFNSEEEFDFIICNPPFFENDLLSPNTNKNIAKHASTLSLEQLFNVFNKLLCKQGIAAIIIPNNQINKCLEFAKFNNLHLIQKIEISQTPKHSIFRYILFFGRSFEKTIQELKISIKDLNDNYTKAFTHLLQDYYLQL